MVLTGLPEIDGSRIKKAYWDGALGLMPSLSGLTGLSKLGNVRHLIMVEIQEYHGYA